jgi:hypothetical protein
MGPQENPTARAGGKEIQRKVDPMRDLFNSNTVMNKIKEMLGEEEGKAFVSGDVVESWLTERERIASLSEGKK